MTLKQLNDKLQTLRIEWKLYPDRRPTIELQARVIKTAIETLKMGDKTEKNVVETLY